VLTPATRPSMTPAWWLRASKLPRNSAPFFSLPFFQPLTKTNPRPLSKAIAHRELSNSLPTPHFNFHTGCEESYEAWSRREPGAMSAHSGLRALSRGGGRGRARDGSQGRGGFQARAGSDDRVRDRTRLQPTRGGSMNNTQNSYAQRGQLIRGNRPTARNGPPPRRPSPAAKTNLEHNTPQRLDPRRAAGRHTVGLLRPVSSAPFTTTNTPRKANTPQKPIWRDPTKVSYTEYKDRMHELWTTVCVNHSILLT